MSVNGNKAGWPEVELGDLLTRIEAGQNFKCDGRPPTDEEVGIVKVSAVTWGEYDEDETKTVTDGDRVDPKLFVQRGDFLFSRANTIQLVGACVIARQVTKRIMLSDKILRFHLRGVDPAWVLYFLRSLRGRRQIESLATGNQESMRNIGQERIRSITLPLPSEPEQRLVLAEVEKQLTRIDAGLAALTRVQANLKRYRASVLKAACEGRLVPTEAELARRESRDYESASVLLQRILKERRHHWEGSELAKLKAKGKHPTDDRWKAKYDEPAAVDIADLPDLPAGWCWARVAQLGQSVTGTTPKTNEPANFDGTLPFFKPTDLDQGYSVRDAREHLTAMGSSGARVLPPRSVLVTCIGATIGKTGLARVACATNQQINALILTADGTLPEYAFWFFCSPLGQNSILAASSATTLPILNKSRFDELLVPLPPLHEQRRIVSEVERLVTRLESLQTAVGTNIVRANRLYQSVLTAAFEGKLAPPASMLAADVEPAAPVVAQRHKGRATVDLADV